MGVPEYRETSMGAMAKEFGHGKKMPWRNVMAPRAKTALLPLKEAIQGHTVSPGRALGPGPAAGPGPQGRFRMGDMTFPNTTFCCGRVFLPWLPLRVCQYFAMAPMAFSTPRPQKQQIQKAIWLHFCPLFDHPQHTGCSKATRPKSLGLCSRNFLR
jgi:hypothetical protein